VLVNLLTLAAHKPGEWQRLWDDLQHTAVLALIVSALALSLGIVNFMRSRRLDKRDLFLRMHEALIAPDVVAGRRVLYTLTSKQQAAALVYQEDEESLVYRALAMFDVLAMYAENKWISEKTVLDEWGNSLSRSLAPAELFIEARYDTIQWHSWPHYKALAQKAKAQRK
jgi:hypothetical protein